MSTVVDPVTSCVVRSVGTAPTWEHGLLMGDGSLGAVLHGGGGRHRITFSHESVVLPADPPRRAPDLAADLPQVRSLVAAGRAQEAAELGVRRSAEQGYPGLQWTDPVVPVAELRIDHPSSHDTGYLRSLDLDTGVAAIGWDEPGGGGRCSVRAFVSLADGVCVVEARGTGVGVELVPPTDVATSTSGVRGGNAERVRRVSASVAGPAAAQSGEPVADDVHGIDLPADWLAAPRGSRSRLRRLPGRPDRVLALVAVSPTTGVPEVPDLPADFDVLLERHLAARARTVPPARLGLGPGGSSGPRRTEELLADEGSEPELLALQYRAAQHTITSSTGRYPPTLQGIWSGTFDPAWSADYTLNGNVQCGSVAGMLSTGGADRLRTHLDLLEGFADDFTDNARRLFGAEGYLLPSRCSISHGRTTHFDERHCHEFWTAGGAWAAAAFLDHCWYTGDVDHLAQHGYPFALEVERFYASFLLEDADGRLLFSPSYSPENTSPTFGSQACRNATMDRAALRLLLTGLERASALLGADPVLDERRRSWARRLPPYRVAPDGTLAEWLDDGVVERVGHRTASQLLDLWFEPDPALTRPGPLRDAVVELVRAKLAWRSSPDGVEEMGYGLVQLGLAAAAVGDAESAHECVRRISRSYFLPSLATTHDVGAIFNVDLSGGLPALVNAMLVGSSNDQLELLPALPTAWAEGAVTGVHARGALVLEELSWAPGSVRAGVRALPGSERLRGGRGLLVRCAGADLGSGPGRPHRLELADGGTTVVHGRRQ